MNKAEIDSLLPLAYEKLHEKQIAENKDGELCIDSSYRSQISSFGAAVTQGSLLAAIAYFSQKADSGSSEVDRSKLMACIFDMVKSDSSKENLFDWAKEGDQDQAKEKILNAAIALKLAINLYKIVKKNDKSKAKNEVNAHE